MGRLTMCSCQGGAKPHSMFRSTMVRWQMANGSCLMMASNDSSNNFFVGTIHLHKKGFHPVILHGASVAHVLRIRWWLSYGALRCAAFDASMSSFCWCRCCLLCLSHPLVVVQVIVSVNVPCSKVLLHHMYDSGAP